MTAARLRSHRSIATSLTGPLGLVGLSVLVGLAGTASLRAIATLALCNLIVVLGLQVFIGNSGVYSFGQLGFAAIGAYVAALFTLPVAFITLQTPDLPGFIAQAQPSPLLATLLTGSACGLLAAIVGLPLMRTSTLAIPISTFAFLIVVYSVLANWDAITGGASGLVSIPSSTGIGSAGLWAAAAALSALAFKWSASGYRLLATREDEVAARSLGISVIRERLIAFALSGAMCGIGGALAVHQSGVLSPATFYFDATVTTLTMLVLGGTRSVFGAVVGTISVTTVNEILHSLENGASLFGVVSIGETPGLAAIGLGLILLVTMIAMPDGLTGGREAGELGWYRSRSGLSPASTALAPPSLVPGPPQGALRAEGISLRFGGLRVLSDVDVTLERGEALGLIGPNGAGKTTLLNVLSGFQQPDAGAVVLDGADVTGLRPDSLARRGVVRSFQDALPFAHLSALENVAIGAMGVGVGRRQAVRSAAMVLDRLGLLRQAPMSAASLPPATQRLLGIARALATSPRYLLLDEPAAALTEAEGEDLVAVLRGVLADFGCGILLIEHDMSVVMGLCGRVQVVEDGATLRVGTSEAVRNDPAVVEAYLGSSLQLANDA